MKRLLALTLATVLLSSPVALAEPVLFPAEDAVIALTIPKGWKAKEKDGLLYANPAADPGYFVEISEMEATPDDGEAVMKEAKESIADSYRKLVYGEVQKAKFDDLGLVILEATGEDDDGKVSLNALLVVNEAKNKVIMLLRVATPENAPKHADAMTQLVNSLRAAKDATPAGGLTFTAKIRKQSFASDVLFRDLTQSDGGVLTADTFYFRDVKTRKLTGIEVTVPYDNKATGVER